ncbi:hypothetical protein PPTG_20871 [Phytophthora nicotianae INRA-310]|uniref:PiggyBac transposable element-derived protein domain-containing protein n=1 Tax=Phytophthora nicotianae (strain INRA-310) TaxID=761204 RepID=W2R9V0_PHYN3|nr:hypothetical protein PPTG_20871 [Phytophthora nicotianae INRA-310]ETN22011.1 hypothetical protein PPTG_20871 [Phytophthora nicotianae INRA-310]
MLTCSVYLLVANADTVNTQLENAGTAGVRLDDNADVDNSSLENADTAGVRVGSYVDIASDDHDEVSMIGSEDDAYNPDDDDDLGDDDSASNEETKDDDVLQVSSRGSRTDHERGPDSDDSRKLLQDTGNSSTLRFDYVDALDPNIVGANGTTYLDTDGEGDDDSVEAAGVSGEDKDSDATDTEKNETASFRRETNRVINRMSAAQRERLHMSIEASSEVFNDEQLDQMKQDGWNVLPKNVKADIVDDPVIDKMYDGYCGPSRDVMPASKSPLKLFYYFLPKTFWRQVATQTNLYWRQTLDARLEKVEEIERTATHRTQRTRATLLRNLQKFQQVSPHEVVQWVGLMLAHTLSPTKSMEMHWCSKEIGVIPGGTFTKVMRRDRFREISRSILSVLEKTFKEAYALGSRVSIDEGVLPSHNRRNPTRTFMKDKPHRWGSKCVMTCCAETGYCKRVEMDIGRSGDIEGSQSMDTKNGLTAVVRNIACVFRGLPYEGRRLVVGDRYYSSIPLAQQLRTMGFNYVGTMQTDRKGWCDQLNYPHKKRRAGTPRGTFQMAVAKSNPGLVSLMWADNTIVYFLASHVIAEPTTVRRRERSGPPSNVPCPGVVAEYQRYMGGVDRHDQLRLQAYSIQMAIRFNKYYKGLFLGLVDMALVNAYILHRHIWEKTKKRRNSHFEFLAALHKALIEETEDSFTQTRTSSGGHDVTERSRPVQGEHTLTQTSDVRMNGGVQRLRQRQCKVCSYYKPEGKKRGGTSTFYCEPCSQGKRGLITLCNKVRGYEKNEGLTCSQIWHLAWKNGEFAPKAAHIRDRALAAE